MIGLLTKFFSLVLVGRCCLITATFASAPILTQDECELICKHCEEDTRFICLSICKTYAPQSTFIKQCVSHQTELSKAKKTSKIKPKKQEEKSITPSLPDLSTIKPMELMKHHMDIINIDNNCYQITLDLCVHPSTPPHCEVNDQEELSSKLSLEKLRFRKPLIKEGKIVYEARGKTEIETREAYRWAFAMEDYEVKPIHLFLSLEPKKCLADSPKIKR